MYTGRNPNEHGNRRIRLLPRCGAFCVQLGMHIRDEFKLVNGICHHTPHPVFDGAHNLAARLVITVQRDILPGNLRPQGNRQFPARCRIKTQTFLIRPPRHGRAQE